jgi:hypothetical protein
MATSEYQPQVIVMHVMFLNFVPFGKQLGSKLTMASGGFPAQLVQCLVARGRNDPPGRRRRDSGVWPSFEGGRKGFLHRFLGERNVAEEASEHRYRAAMLAPKDCCDFRAQQ